MRQYLNHLDEINCHGTVKPAARAAMPGTISYFGYQNRYDLSKGFPILTTKKVSFKNIVTELLWFLKGDTNIKYLIDNGVNFWNEDAYNYYKKTKQYQVDQFSFNQFIEWTGVECSNYTYGDCGKQYGYQWRQWNGRLDQIQELIDGLKNTPESRRHIVTAWNPSDMNDLALHPCHAFFQMNCRPINLRFRMANASEELYAEWVEILDETNNSQKSIDEISSVCDKLSIPRYYLDCEMYQRSADMILRVPYNISSYALLTELVAKIVNMIPGQFIHTFGDSHIYDNHKDAFKEIYCRKPGVLPAVEILERSDRGSLPDHFEKYLTGRYSLSDFINSLSHEDFKLVGYNPQPAIKAELSTGLIK